MAWDFTVDSDIQTELAKNLNDYADKYDGKVNEMYSKISDMGTYWVGDDYDLFQSSCEGYRTALDDLANSIRLYSVHFGHVAEGTEALAQELVELIQGMTEYTGAGGTAQPGTGNTNGGCGSSGGQNGGGTGGQENGTGEEENGSNSQGNGSGEEEGGNGNEGNGTTSEEEGDEGGEGSGNGSGAEEEETTSGTADARNQYSSGDPVQIDGKDYNVYGYVTGKDGSSVGLYEGTDGKLYYFDKEGNRHNVKAKAFATDFFNTKKEDFEITRDAVADGIGDKREGYKDYCYEIDGVEYGEKEVYSSGYSDANVTYNDEGTHNTYRDIKKDSVAERTYTDLETTHHGGSVSLADHKGTPTLAVPGNTDAFMEAAKNGQAIKLQDGHSFNYLGETFGGSGTTYLVCKDGKYFEADKYGNIINHNKYISIIELIMHRNYGKFN